MKAINSTVAYNYIRQKIASGAFPPGYSLTASALSEEIGVSRTPVRDALRQLEADGLVVIQAHLGASVKSVDVKEYRDICLMRLALESYAASLAARYRTDLELKEIQVPLEAMRRLTEKILQLDEEESLFADLAREDVRFHIAIITAAKSDLMKKEILRLHLINRVVSGPSPVPVPESKEVKDKHRRNALASHEAIYRAIAKGDPIASRNAMESHIQDIIDYELDILALKGAENGSTELSVEELLYKG